MTVDRCIACTKFTPVCGEFSETGRCPSCARLDTTEPTRPWLWRLRDALADAMLVAERLVRP